MFGLNIDVEYRADIQAYTNEDMGKYVNDTGKRGSANE